MKRNQVSQHVTICQLLSVIFLNASKLGFSVGRNLLFYISLHLANWVLNVANEQQDGRIDLFFSHNFHTNGIQGITTCFNKTGLCEYIVCFHSMVNNYILTFTERDLISLDKEVILSSGFAVLKC
jgi:hypothetical protein